MSDINVSGSSPFSNYKPTDYHADFSKGADTSSATTSSEVGMDGTNYPTNDQVGNAVNQVENELNQIQNDPSSVNGENLRNLSMNVMVLVNRAKDPDLQKSNPALAQSLNTMFEQLGTINLNGQDGPVPLSKVIASSLVYNDVQQIANKNLKSDDPPTDTLNALQNAKDDFQNYSSIGNSFVDDLVDGYGSYVDSSTQLGVKGKLDVEGKGDGLDKLVVAAERKKQAEENEKAGLPEQTNPGFVSFTSVFGIFGKNTKDDPDLHTHENGELIRFNYNPENKQHAYNANVNYTIQQCFNSNPDNITHQGHSPQTLDGVTVETGPDVDIPSAAQNVRAALSNSRQYGG